MANHPITPNDNPAQVRGDISLGLTGDKRPGFDPALAPLETDSEAGGVPLSAEQVQMARETQRSALPQQQSRNFDVAMRYTDGSTFKKRLSMSTLLPLGVAVALAVVFVTAYLIMR